MPISKINTSSITDNSVTAGKIVAGAVDADIAAGSIDTAQIADDAVTTDKLANAINTSIAAKAPVASPVFTGNVGVGVTPETWQSGWSALQIGGLTSYYAPTTTSASQSLMINNNAYNDGAWKYLITDEASSYYQLHGGHTFRVAPSGTADSAISWTTGFEVLADGKARAKNGLLFGTDTAAANALDDYEEGYYDPSVSAYGTNGAFGFAGASNTLVYTKIGRTVHVQGYISITDMSGTDTGHLIMSLPFTGATLNDDCGYNLSSVVLQNHGGSITGNVYLFVIGSTAYFYKVQTDGSGSYIMVQHVDTTFQIGVNFTYLAA
jgi:hypothetical protein